MKQRHTPGPWRVEWTPENPMGVCSPSTWQHDLDLLCMMPYTEWGTDRKDEVAANARLIAAAPELLRACQTLRQVCEEITKENGTNEHFRQLESVKRIDTAIAKAEGSE